MTDADWKRVLELYEVAQTLPAMETERFLATLSDSPEVIGEVRILLASLPAEEEMMEASHAGESIGPYEVLHRIGQGASADVYAGRDTRLNRVVALKFLKADSESHSRRLMREAQSVSSLNHPNIVTVHEVLNGPSGPVLVMELVEGEWLRQRCGAPVPEAEAVRIGVQISRALAAAHAKGFVHRDLKPENVMLRPDGYLKVLDFGLVRRLTEAGDPGNLTSTAGLPVGTLRYMSPEQCKGEPATPKSDLFALGIILYELVCGRHPFADASGLEIAHAIVSENPSPPAGASAAFRQLLLELLAKDPAARPASQEAAARLEALSGGYSSSGTPAIPAAQPLFTRRRVAAATLSVAAVASVTGGLLWRRRQSESGAILSGGLIRDPVFSPDGSRLAFCWQRPGSTGFQLFLTRPSGEDPTPLTAGAGDDYDPAWSPDGAQIAFVRKGRGESALYVIGLDGSPERRITSITPDADSRPRISWLSPARLVVADRNTAGRDRLYSVDAGSGERTELNPSADGFNDGVPRVSPDGRLVAFSRFFGPAASDVFVMPASGGSPRRITNDEKPKRELRWSPDGRSILYRSPKPRWRLWEAGIGGEQEREVRLPQAALGNFDVRAGGGGSRQVVLAQTNERFSIWRSDRTPGGSFAPATPFIASGPGFLDVNPAISPDGLRIAFVSTRTGAPEIWVADADGNNPQQVTSFNLRHVTVPAWTSDSQRLLSAARIGGSGEIFLIDARSGATPQVFGRPGVEDSEPQFSPDGRFITFSVQVQGRFELFRMPVTGGPAIQLTRRGCVIHRHSPDGKWIYLIRANEQSGLFRIPAAGGNDELVLDQVKSPLYRGWAVGRHGIYYTVQVEGESRWEIRYFDPVKGTRTPVLPLSLPLPRWSGTLSLSRDERWMAFPLQEPAVSQLVHYPEVR